MLGHFLGRKLLSAAVILLYFLPLFCLVCLQFIIPNDQVFVLFSIGLLFVTLGALFFQSVLNQWEKNIKSSFISAKIYPDDNNTNSEIELKNAEIQSLLQSQEELVAETKQNLELISKENESLINQINHKDNILEQCEQTIAELRASEDRKQQRISNLESKVRDLSYEIKTLLQLTEIPDTEPIEPKKTPSLEETTRPYRVQPPTKNQELSSKAPDATAQLKRCIDIAQKMTGASHYSAGNSRFRSIPVNNFALDLRCLFDSLRSENSTTVLFYSPKEHKLLFANEQTRKLTGWSPEKFVQNFDNIVQEGKDEWLAAIKQLSIQSESKIRLILKTRSGEDTLVHGLLGTIPTGIFRHHVIAILFNADHRHALSNSA